MELVNKLTLSGMPADHAAMLVDTLLTILDDLEPATPNTCTDIYSTRELNRMIVDHTGIPSYIEKIAISLRYMGFQSKVDKKDLSWYMKSKPKANPAAYLMEPRQKSQQHREFKLQ